MRIMNKKIKLLLTLAFTLVFGFGVAHAFSINNMTLKFAQLSDTHISDRPDTSYKLLSKSKPLLGAAIRQLNKIEGLDFVMFTAGIEQFYMTVCDIHDICHGIFFHT